MKNQPRIFAPKGIEVTFPNQNNILPKDLISLSKEYVMHIPQLMEHIQKEYVTILFLRKEVDGIFRKKVEGKVSKINFSDKSFDFCPKENEETGSVIHCRTDNVLGLIPIIPDCDINPFQNSHTKQGMEYIHSLRKMRELAKLCVGTTHKAVLFYRDKNARTEEICSEIIKVNKSNLEIINHKSERIFEGGKSVILGKRNTTELNISTKKYLYGISVIFGSEHNISPFDDGDEF